LLFKTLYSLQYPVRFSFCLLYSLSKVCQFCGLFPSQTRIHPYKCVFLARY